ncbi:hypothetical protein AWB78_08496 [Caballeronia calidae]|uniref:Uncharacterized protein n=1 Tax=Caballeronia calidae TaxID=1777139 RepID=A0A158EK70_9BURK|nr:hypothetical protein [Caballeronia calidae]SAL07249.1 hypothetical protein AWB78_08496 [Caballeronia calidae]
MRSLIAGIAISIGMKLLERADAASDVLADTGLGGLICLVGACARCRRFPDAFFNPARNRLRCVLALAALGLCLGGRSTHTPYVCLLRAS